MSRPSNGLMTQARKGTFFQRMMKPVPYCAIDDQEIVACSGYKHANYAYAFSDLGEPIQLPRSKGWLLRREIPGTSWYDAMGCYPFFTSNNWEALSKDLESIKESCLTVTMVTDPFGDFSKTTLSGAFTDHLIRFKKHHVIDLSYPIESYVSNHHRRNAFKALQNVSVIQCERPDLFVEQWMQLYGHLIQKRAIKGMLSFSKNIFSKMLRVPGATLFKAATRQDTVCMQIWYEQDGVAHYHLGASSPLGYSLKAAFAVFWMAISHFAEKGLKWVGLGSGAGLHDDPGDGLNRFKKGWANSYRFVYLGGRVLNQELYRELCKLKGGEPSNYFPLYRRGEF